MVDIKFFNEVMNGLYSKDNQEGTTITDFSQAIDDFYNKWLCCYNENLLDGSFRITMKGIDFVTDLELRNTILELKDKHDRL